MASPTTKSFTTLVSDMATAVQGKASALADFTVGSILRSLVEAFASVGIWIEGLILLLLQTTRLSTSSGSDVDTFIADFGQTRLPAVAAVGQVTFSRFTPTMQATIPVGTAVQSTDGTQQYLVIADATQAAYNATLGAYIIPAGTGTAVATVQAVNAGSQGNVGAGQISVIAQALVYVDQVTNANAFISGQDAESDAATKSGFVTFIGSLSKATKVAIINAAQSLQVGITAAGTENQSYAGAYQPGYFYVVVDDGTGHPSGGFLSAVANAIDATRAYTVTFGVFGPVVETANVAMTAVIALGYDPVATKAAVQAAVVAYIASLTLGQTLYYNRLVQIALDGSPGVTNITGLTINGSTADLTATAQQRVIGGTVVVN